MVCYKTPIIFHGLVKGCLANMCASEEVFRWRWPSSVEVMSELPCFLKTWSLASTTSNDKQFCEYCLLLIPMATNTGKFKFTFNDLPNWALSQGRKVSDCAHATLEEVAHLVCLRASLKSCCSLWKASWNACYPFERPLPRSSPRQPGAPTCPTNCHPLSDSAFSHNKQPLHLNKWF